METDKVENSLVETLVEDQKREDDFGEYHPSEVTGCPLKVFLEKMTRNPTDLSSYLLQGTAVHYYLQEDGVLDDALEKAGYHPLDTEYEVNTKKKINDEVLLTGTCDILTEGRAGRTIFDIKYSSLYPSKDSGRLLQYFSQTNTYSYMFDAEEYAIMLIRSNSMELEDNVFILEGSPDEDNWELVKSKAKAIHAALKHYGYPDDVVWQMADLDVKEDSFWHDILEFFDEKNCPAYKKECSYCDHSDYCPIKNGKTKGGLTSFKGGRN